MLAYKILLFLLLWHSSSALLVQAVCKDVALSCCLAKVSGDKWLWHSHGLVEVAGMCRYGTFLPPR